MAPEQNPEELFHRALELKDPEKRAAYLDEACAGNAELRAQVDALLRWDSQAGGFMDLPEKTIFTRYSQMIGTPEHMSQEQAEMSGLDVDTRTDASEAASWSGLGGDPLSFISWSADGKRLAFGCDWQGGLWVYDLDAKQATKIVDGSCAWCS